MSAVVAGVISITVFLAVSIEWAAEYIPFEFETALSQPVAEKLNSEAGEVDEYLQQLADKIIPFMDLPEDVEVKVHYADEDFVNAMATLGGHVVIYRGLLEQIPDENTLVMLLGHEIGHVKLRHPVKTLGKGVVMSLILSAILGQSSDSVANLITDTSMLTMLSFSRDQEQASDEEGINALNAYYGHVQGATELFDTLEKAHEATTIDPPQFLNSHPDTQTRKDYLNALAQVRGWAQQGKPIPLPRSVLDVIAAHKRQARDQQETDNGRSEQEKSRP